MAITSITLERVTGASVFENDQSDPPLTREQADVVAETYMDGLVARLTESYPEATIEVVAGNVLGGGTQIIGDSWQEENDASSHLQAIGMALWESAAIWSV